MHIFNFFSYLFFPLFLFPLISKNFVLCDHDYITELISTLREDDCYSHFVFNKKSEEYIAKSLENNISPYTTKNVLPKQEKQFKKITKNWKWLKSFTPFSIDKNNIYKEYNNIENITSFQQTNVQKIKLQNNGYKCIFVFILLDNYQQRLLEYYVILNSPYLLTSYNSEMIGMSYRLAIFHLLHTLPIKENEKISITEKRWMQFFFFEQLTFNFPFRNYFILNINQKNIHYFRMHCCIDLNKFITMEKFSISFSKGERGNFIGIFFPSFRLGISVLEKNKLLINILEESVGHPLNISFNSDSYEYNLGESFARMEIDIGRTYLRFVAKYFIYLIFLILHI